MKLRSILVLAFSMWGTVAAANEEKQVMTSEIREYPSTRSEDLVEEKFGERIADPYRWLENDVREDAEVADWVSAQNAHTFAYLETLPMRASFRERIGQLFDFERYSTPVKRGSRYFYNHNSGL